MSELKSKLSNFWYYYKVHTIICVFLAIVLAVLISQCAAKEKYDYSVALYMEKQISEDVCDIIAQELARFGEDLDGDGKVNVEIINCSYGSNDNVRISQMSKLQARLTMPESVLYIVDEACYSNLDPHGVFEGFPGFNDKGGYAFALSGTKMDNEIFRNLGISYMPKNYYICKRVYTDDSAEDGRAGFEQQSTELLTRLIAEYSGG